MTALNDYEEPKYVPALADPCSCGGIVLVETYRDKWLNKRIVVSGYCSSCLRPFLLPQENLMSMLADGSIKMVEAIE